MNAVEKFAPLLGRILIAVLFIPAGIGKLKGFEGTVQYIASQGLPLPQVGAVVAIVVEVLVALALLVGFKGRIAALILALFTLATALCFHQYWAAAPEQVMAQSINFFKNMAIAGGLLFVAAFGPGPFSIDTRKR
ncbi:DoxX family protein [Niveibacterium sp. SC-1]|uniref:DoxX family protein n=1 Tax=Niveibacterium sp. SC-1 TaxID=3135646 RepID=UPI00311DD484